jgi:periplasmic protein TonB
VSEKFQKSSARARLFFLRDARYRVDLRCPKQQTDLMLEDAMVKEAALEHSMFANSILETSWAQRSRRSWTTLTSFGVQAVVIGLLLLIPLLTSVVLPPSRLLPTPVSWGGTPPPARPIVPRQHPTVVVSNLVDNRLVAPPVIPSHVAMIEETGPPPQISYDNGPAGPGGTGSGSGDGVPNSTNEIAAHPSPPPAAPAPPARPIRISSMLKGTLLRQVQPVYPVLAKNAHIEGAVVLEAVISKTGTIENLQLVSGHPLLVQSAIEAVRQWRYKPYVLNGDAIEVETQITVNFTLSGK